MQLLMVAASYEKQQRCRHSHTRYYKLCRVRGLAFICIRSCGHTDSGQLFFCGRLQEGDGLQAE